MPKQTLYKIVGAMAACIILWNILLNREKEIDIQQLRQEFLANGKVKKILVNTNTQRAYIYDSNGVATHYVSTGADVAVFEQLIIDTEVELELPETNIEYTHAIGAFVSLFISTTFLHPFPPSISYLPLILFFPHSLSI